MEEKVTTEAVAATEGTEETTVAASESKESKKASKKKSEAKACTIMEKVGREAMKQHGLSEVYVTSDGQAFAQKSDAMNHAANLKNQEVVTVN